MSRVSRDPLLLRMLLRLYPPDFRERYSESILWFHRQRLADSKLTGESLNRVWRRTVVDLLTTAFIEWVHTASARQAVPRTYVIAPLSAKDRMSIIMQELVQSVRSLRRSAGFTAAAVVTLA